MATQTQHLLLQKPAYEDPADISVLNANFTNLDSAIYADRLVIGDVEENSGGIAARNHSIGEVFIVDGACVKATANIAAGDTFILNTNIEPTSIAEELKQCGGTFSTTEQRVGTWIDGKPLYQCTLVTTFTSSQVSASATFAHNIANIDECVNAWGVVQHTVLKSLYTSALLALNNTSNPSIGGDVSAYLKEFNSTEIVWFLGSTYEQNTMTRRLVTTVQYTKTTS